MVHNEDFLRAWRLHSQKMAPQRCQSPEDVVERLGGVQAQNYDGAKWSTGLRGESFNEAVVDKAIHDLNVVRTWAFRGTLHFLVASDLTWLSALLAPGIIKGNARRYRELELKEVDFQKSQEVLRQVLQGKRSLTRSKIKALFKDQGVPAEGQQVPYLLQRAALDGLICHGPQLGGETTYVLATEWVKPGKSLDRPEALRNLAFRYFSSHGPATERDFAWWAGLTLEQARSAMNSTSELVLVELEGICYWAVGEPPPRETVESGFLLPPFDEYLLGYQDRSAILDRDRTKRVNPGGGMLKPTVVLNGEILGTWRSKVRKTGMEVSIQPFGDLDSNQRDLIDLAASRLADYKSLPVEVIYETIKTP
jgi:hypothetical protein